MIDESKRNLANSGRPFNHEVVAVQSIPYADATFDAVIANHMLYHVPDLEKAISETRRILKPTGKLFNATNGKNHMRELYELEAKFESRMGSREGGRAWYSFETG